MLGAIATASAATTSALFLALFKWTNAGAGPAGEWLGAVSGMLGAMVAIAIARMTQKPVLAALALSQRQGLIEELSSISKFIASINALRRSIERFRSRLSLPILESDSDPHHSHQFSVVHMTLEEADSLSVDASDYVSRFDYIAAFNGQHELMILALENYISALERLNERLQREVNDPDYQRDRNALVLNYRSADEAAVSVLKSADHVKCIAMKERQRIGILVAAKYSQLAR